MRVLYSALLYNYAKPEEGYSYEHHNLEAGIKECDFDVDCFYVDQVMLDNPDDPKKAVHDQFFDLVQNGQHDAIFHVPFNEHYDLPVNVMKYAIKKEIPVIAWECDASWKFHNFIKGRKDRYSHFVTTHSATIPWFEAEGMNIIRSQWGGSPLYKRDTTMEKIYDVSFVGQKHGIRPQIVEAISNAGIKLDLFGHYWESYPNWHGYLPTVQDIVKVFNQSKICLNLSNPWHVGTMPQIKGRHFEIPQAGGFQLSTPADDLQRYFKIGEEIVLANSVEELISALRYYLEHEDERNAISKAGYIRTQNDHQWKNRFQEIFTEIGLIS